MRKVCRKVPVVVSVRIQKNSYTKLYRLSFLPSEFKELSEFLDFVQSIAFSTSLIVSYSVHVYHRPKREYYDLVGEFYEDVFSFI